MTIFSAQLKFSDEQAVTASAASTNIIDLGASAIPAGSAVAPKQDIGPGTKLPVVVNVTEAFATLTSLQVKVQVATDAAFTTPIDVAMSGAIAVADLVAGKLINFPDCIPEGTNERFVRLLYTVVGTDATGGKLPAGITMGRQTNG